MVRSGQRVGNAVFKVGRSWQNNVQFERALSDRYSFGIGASYVKGYDLPVVTNINLINPASTLPDGIPVFATAINAGTRVDPRYNVINSSQSIGESTYKNMTLQFTRRAGDGIQFDVAYTLGKSSDTAPTTGILSVQGDVGRSNPEDLEYDRGPNVLDQRHTLSASFVATPRYNGDNAVWRGLLNGTVIGIGALAANGIPINIRATGEINNDGIGSDRPAGVPRNSLTLPARKNVDLRLSRQIPIGRTKAEIIAEVTNIFNTVQWSGVSNASVAVVAGTGVPVNPLPTSGDQLTPSGGYEQRQFQLGFKFIF